MSAFRRGRFQYGLKTMFWVVAIVCSVSAGARWLVSVRRAHEIAELREQLEILHRIKEEDSPPSPVFDALVDRETKKMEDRLRYLEGGTASKNDAIR